MQSLKYLSLYMWLTKVDIPFESLTVLWHVSECLLIKAG